MKLRAQNNKNRRLWIAVTAVMLALSMMGMGAASSSAQSNSVAQKATNPIACAEDGDLDFIAFLSASVAYDGIVEYWEDIFRNSCQQADIYNVINRIDKLRANLRNAFYNCDDEKVDLLKKENNDLETELYYVRHVVSTDSKAPKNGIAVFDNRKNDKLYKQMLGKFVDDKAYYSGSDFDKLYAKLTKQYEQRVDSYLNCEDVTFDELKDKWAEFVETAGGLKTGAENAQKHIDRAEDSLAKSPALSLENVFGDMLEVRLNGVDVITSIKQIFEDSKKDIPFADGEAEKVLGEDSQSDSGAEDGGANASDSEGSSASTSQSSDSAGPSYADIVERYLSSGTKAQLDFNEAELKAKYDFLNKGVNDAITKSLEQKLIDTNNVIKSSFKELDQIGSCTSNIVSRQCKSKE